MQQPHSLLYLAVEDMNWHGVISYLYDISDDSFTVQCTNTALSHASISTTLGIKCR